MIQIKKIALIYITLIFSINLVAQEKPSYAEIDKKTYNQYLQGEWKELIKTGKLSIKNEIDFYYLQVRIGIAYYELKKYRLAIPYLEKAQKLNKNNELVTEYLYFSYLFSGRNFDARKLSGSFSEALKIKLGIKESPIISALSFDLRKENFENFKAEPAIGELLQQDVKNDYSYFSIGVEHLIENNRKIFWSFSRLKINSTVYNIGELNNQIDDEREVSQNQYYYSYHNQLSNGLNLVLAANILNIVSEGSTLSATGSWGGGWGGGSGGWGGGSGGIITTRFVSNELVGYFALRKDFSNFQFGLNSSLSNLDKNFQFQPGIDFTWYPLANTNIYLSTKANYWLENINNQWKNEPVVKQAVGFRLLTFYFEPSITYGNIINFTENNAFIVNNDNDVIKERYEFLIYGSFFKNKLNLFIKYQNYLKTNTYLLNGVSNEISYQNQTLTGGIKWNF
ncbi:MAG: tetratricopeptide repeat protein [Bacteroidota bacterium]